jgi:hypothetical protein
MPLIQLDERQRQHLLWFARARNAPAWFIAALERAAPPALPLTRWPKRH